MIKTLLSLLTLSAVVVPSVRAQSYDDYLTLAKAVVSVGVEVKLNTVGCDRDGVHGWFNGTERELVVCQQNRVKGSTQEVRWTAEDYDTLLHEVHHVVQDCMDSKIDGDLRNVYRKPLSFSLEVLGSAKIGEIIEGYDGLSVVGKINELEAFAVARLNDPHEQLDDVRKYCM